MFRLARRSFRKDRVLLRPARDGRSVFDTTLTVITCLTGHTEKVQNRAIVVRMGIGLSCFLYLCITGV